MRDRTDSVGVLRYFAIDEDALADPDQHRRATW